MKKPSLSTVTKPTISTTAKISQIASLKPTTVNLPKSSPPPLDSLSVNSLLPPLPKSRLKAPTLTIAGAKQNANAANSKRITSMTVAEKPVAAVTGLVKCSSIKSPSVSKKPANATVASSKARVTVKPKGMVNPVPNTRRSSGRRSTLDSTDSSLYVSALSEV